MRLSSTTIILTTRLPVTIALSVSCCLLAFSGCGGEPFPLTHVSGTVTYDDGELIAAERIHLVFIPQDAEVDDVSGAPPSGRASVDPTDGTFESVTSHRFGDGIVPGRHKVLVYAIDADERPTAAVPRHYQEAATTPLEVDTADTPFELRITRP